MKQYWGMVLAVGFLVAMAVPLMAEDGTAEGHAKHLEAVKAKHEAKAEERKTEAAKRHEDNMALLKDKLAKNTKLTDAEKEEISNFFEQQFGENVSFRDTQQAENMKFLDDLINQPDLTKDQVKQVIKDHRDKQKEENKAHRAEQKSERQAQKNAHHDVKAAAGN